MFSGFVVQESTLKGVLQSTTSALVPVDADALPTFRVYGPSGYLGVSGTCSLLDSGSITGATNASPIVITSANHGLTTGARVTISGVGGNTAANTTAVITRVDANTFSLNGVAGSGAYTSGGTWHVTGAYGWSIACTGANGFAAGEKYDVVFSFTVSSAGRQPVQTFCVV